MNIVSQWKKEVLEHFKGTNNKYSKINVVRTTTMHAMLIILFYTPKVYLVELSNRNALFSCCDACQNQLCFFARSSVP